LERTFKSASLKHVALRSGIQDANHVILPAGWIGVDIFFTLSGYLITSLLLREMAETGSINFGNFYARRALRLAPAFLLLVTFQLIRSAFSPHGEEIRRATLIAVAYVENFNMTFGWGPTELIGHTWSLATEEQFYLLWPLVLLFIIHRRPGLWLAIAAAAMLATGLLAVRSHVGPAYLQFNPAIRPFGLLIGCLLALVPVTRWPRLRAAIPATALASLIGIAALYKNNQVSDMCLVLCPLVVSVATAVIVVSARRESPTSTSKLLSIQPLVYIGKISSGLYLFSAPIFYLGEHEWKLQIPFHLYGVALIALIFLVSAISYEFIEKPFLRLKERFQRRTAIGIPAGAG